MEAIALGSSQIISSNTSNDDLTLLDSSSSSITKSPGQITNENNSNKSPISRSPNKSPVPTISQKRIIENGYVKKSEPADAQHMAAIGLKPEDAKRTYICDQVGDYVMIHFKDEFDKIPTSARDSSQESLDSSPQEFSEQAVMSPTEDISEVKARISMVRGWILKKSVNGDQISYTLEAKSYSESAMFFTTPEEFDQIEWDDYIFKPHVEGITIRVFWDLVAGEWKHASHKKINCFKSRVPGVEIEFRELFQQASPNFNYERLNKNLVYIFHIMHRDNQHMNPEPVEKAVLYHLMTMAGSNTICPMKLLEPNSIVLLDAQNDHNLTTLDKLAIVNVKLEGVEYLETIPTDQVSQLLSKGKRVMAQNGYEITQIVPESLRKLIEIRGYEKTKHIPVELMYMRLPKEDRPYLVYAVPYHMRNDASMERMERYLIYNIERLSHVCAYVLFMKIRGVDIKVSQTILWLVKQVVLVVRDLPYEQIRYQFFTLINAWSESKGDTIYRCFKTMDHVILKIKEAQSVDIDAIVNCYYQFDPKAHYPPQPVEVYSEPVSQNNFGATGQTFTTSNNQVLGTESPLLNLPTQDTIICDVDHLSEPERPKNNQHSKHQNNQPRQQHYRNNKAPRVNNGAPKPGSFKGNVSIQYVEPNNSNRSTRQKAKTTVNRKPTTSVSDILNLINQSESK